jgi:hypothetical protein
MCSLALNTCECSYWLICSDLAPIAPNGYVDNKNKRMVAEGGETPCTCRATAIRQIVLYFDPL